VIWRRSEPSTAIRQISGLPVSMEMKAIKRPSGEYDGFLSDTGPWDSRRAWPPSGFILQTWE
jgi:hypothetical protein